MLAADLEGSFGNAENGGDFAVWKSVLIPEEKEDLVVRREAMKVRVEMAEASVDVGAGVEHDLFGRGEFSPVAMGEDAESLAGYAQNPGALVFDKSRFSMLALNLFEYGAESGLCVRGGPKHRLAEIKEKVAVKVDDPAQRVGG